MSNINFQVSAKREVLQQLIGTAGQFTTKDTGAPTYLKSVYLEASKKGVKAIGASEHKAIELSSSEVSVEVPGRVLVLSSWINASLGVIQPGAQVTLTQFEVDVTQDSKGHHIQLKSGDQEIDFDVTEIDEKMHIPDVGDYDSSVGTIVSSEDFVDAFNTVSAATSKSGNSPIMSGVFMEDSNKQVRLFASNGTGVTSTRAISSESVGNQDGIRTVMDANLTLGVSELFKEGEKIAIHISEDDNLHFIVSAKDTPIYHIRLASIGQDVSSYPAAKVAARNLQLIQGSKTVIEVDKLELLRILDSAATIAGLDPTETDGQRRRCHLTFDDSHVYVKVNGKARYEDQVELISCSSENGMSVDFDFYHGLYTQFFRLSPGREKLRIRVIEAGGVPKALCLVNDGEIDLSDVGDIKDADFDFDLGRLPEYFSIFLIADGKYIEQK